MIDLGKAIYAILNGQNIKCFPLIAEQGTEFPFVVYKRSSYTPTVGKDRMAYNADVTMEVSIIANSYDESVTTANTVINALDFKRGTIEDINIIDTQLIDASEDYNEDSYIQTLTFKFKI